MLSPEGVVALVPRLVSPRLYPVSVLQVVLPHAFVLSSIDMFVDTSAICLVVSPVAIIDVTVDMDESAFAVGPILTPLARVLGPVVPCLLTETVTEAALPLPGVYGTSLEGVRRSLLALLVWVVHVPRHRLTGLFLSEVLTAAHLLCSEQ